MRFLAVDPGGQRMGIAVGDDQTGIVTPLRVLPYSGVDGAAGELADLVAEHRIDKVIIGLPCAEDGSRTPACARSEALARALDQRAIETGFQSEFLTTNEARRRASEVGRRPSRPVDDLAAQILLEEYLAGGER